MLGPFYEPAAPVRTRVDSGYVLSGTVLAAEECKPIRDARMEFWLANPRGDYDDAHRATVLAGQRGEYRFESNVPVSYGGRSPHIHVRVRAPGYEELVTQHYPERGQRKANFDLVLVAQ
jgi:protocatechuate 3,4-dioxygenase beta subunit